jgi:hypothetical protein
VRWIALGDTIGRMGIMSWLFPSNAHKLERARRMLAGGKYEEARTLLLRVQGPLAEELYEEATRQRETHDEALEKKREVETAIEAALFAVALVRAVDPMRLLAESELKREQEDKTERAT